MNDHRLLHKPNRFFRFAATDSVCAALTVVLMVTARFTVAVRTPDIYEEIIFWLCLPLLIALQRIYRPLRFFIPAVMLFAGLAVFLYGNDFSAGERVFGLKYALSGQSAILWQCFLTVAAFSAFAVGFIVDMRRADERDGSLIGIACGLAWAAAGAGTVGLLVRWHESHLLGPDTGHIPVSNLYEVFILFMVFIGLMFLYYADKHRLRRLGVFVYALQCVSVGFVLWYGITRGAQEIRPLVPALQSWWMKIHVPANFIGYGGFCIAAMLAVAELLALRREERGAKRRFLPAPEIIEEAMYQAVAVGFLFFTVATVLGALWAADAWGSYWSWDPKETWALIVWLNYAVWLHLRLVSGWRGKILAWWALIGLLITAFAFVGVNMFLSGLHSYGGL